MKTAPPRELPPPAEQPPPLFPQDTDWQAVAIGAMQQRDEFARQVYNAQLALAVRDAKIVALEAHLKQQSK